MLEHRESSEEGLPSTENKRVIWDFVHPRDVVRRLTNGEMPPDTARTVLGGLQLEVSREATMLPSLETYLHARAVGTALRTIVQSSDLEAPIKVGDVGTGSGVIAIAVARELQDEIRDGRVTVIANDISEKALEDAQRNAAANNVTGIEFVHGDGLASYDRLDVIVTNPPFMKSSALKQPGAAAITQFVPPRAVVAGPTGMDFYERFFGESRGVLSPTGMIVVQHQDFDHDTVVGKVVAAMGTSIPIADLYGKRQTALAIGNPAWSKKVKNAYSEK